VPLIDPRTGLIDRAWYLFFLSLNDIATNVVDDVNLATDSISLIASYDAALQALAQEVETQPPPVDLSAELIKQIEAAGLIDCCSGLLSQIAEIQKQIDALNASPNLRPPSVSDVSGLGTMAVQNADAVAITGGTINNTTIGATTPSTGVFTTLTANSTAQFGRGSANYFEFAGAATTKAVEVKALGSDTNIAFVIDSKGTGAIDLAAGSSGVNISNGGTVTAITRTATGSGYTSFPSVAISAPTTAGGVQATATVTNMFASGVTVQSGGTGYTVGNVLTVSGGTPQTAVQLTVSTVSAGVITAVTVSNAGAYTALPTNPVSVTGGTGSGATFNLTWAVIAFTITNAGSGYVEQPTVSFSGGGGSGAAAYATVGSAVILKSIGGTLDLSTTNGIGLRIYDSGGTVPSSGYWAASSGTSSPFLWARGGTNTTGLITSSGTGSVSIQTNAGSQTQFNVSHTASAVNYVQVTGAATGVQPTISAQGSDTNIRLALSSKGTSSVRVISNNGAVFDAIGVSSAANLLNFNNSVASSAPSISVVGTDTNIDLTLTPKGTGNVRFGTYTGTISAITGYIEIKTADGTVRRLAVVA
jgi:hypothetical protein